MSTIKTTTKECKKTIDESPSTNQKLLNRNLKIRPIKLRYDALGYADASVLFEIGQTKVLASVTLQEGTPPFLRGQKTGWLTAEYSMLPCATHKRTKRESTQHNRNSRSVEISRLIGRCLRSVVNLSLLGEKTIIIGKIEELKENESQVIFV